MTTPKPALAEASPAKRTYTAWEAFAKAGLRPTSIDCQGYPVPGIAKHDFTCHTHLLLSAGNIKRHIEAGHSGEFRFFLKKSDSKTPHPIWKELEELGIEAQDFRCHNCDKTLRFHPTAILPCMRAHGGKTRRVFPGGNYNLTLSFAKPEQGDEDGDLLD